MNGLHELPLIIFTVLAQSVVGAFLLFCLVLVTTKDEQYKAYVHKAMFVLLILLGIGFTGSIAHLGSPMRAFNSLNRVGESMLSNEIASGALFFALVGSYWLLAMLNKMPKALGSLWLALSALIGIVFMYMMSNVYQILTVPTWHTSFTHWHFYLSVILGGFTLGYALLHCNCADVTTLRWIPSVVLTAVIVAAIVSIYQGFSLSHITTSAQKATELIPDFAVLNAIRFICLSSAAALLCYIACKPAQLFAKVTAVLLVLAGEMIGRTLFYALHMTVGTTIGG